MRKPGLVASTLPAGVRLHRLQMYPDHRGDFTEIFREEWGIGISPVQWNVVHSRAGTFRGVHVHPRHDDYLLIVGGRATVGVRDLRRESPTEGLSATVELRGDRLAGLVVPHGVAHGFYFHEDSTHIYSVSHYFDPEDELACRWSDPALGISWPFEDPLLSDRDASAGSLAELMERLEPLQPI